MNLLTIGSGVVTPRELLEAIASTQQRIMSIFAADFELSMAMLDDGVAVSSVLLNTGSRPATVAAQAAAIIECCDNRRVRVGAVSRDAGHTRMRMFGADADTPPPSGSTLAALIRSLDPRQGPEPARSGGGGAFVPVVAPAAVDGARAASGDLDIELDAPSLALTPRQRQVLESLRGGRSNREIAVELAMAEGTVKAHCKSIYRALGVTNRTQAAVAGRDADVTVERFG